MSMQDASENLDLLRDTEVAELLSTSRQAVWNLINQGLIDIISLRGVGCRIPRKAVEDFIRQEQQRTNGNAAAKPKPAQEKVS